MSVELAQLAVELRVGNIEQEIVHTPICGIVCSCQGAKESIVIAANMLGKIKTCTQIACVILCILEPLLAYNIEGMIVLSGTVPSRELASYGVPVVGIEREDQFISSVNTDNYMGGVQAASLLRKSGCDIIIHVNADMPDSQPASGRIRGFVDTCEEYRLPYELILTDLGNTFEENRARISALTDQLEQKYPGKRKGIFMPNDTHANVLLNLLIQRYGSLPDTYQIIGFDNSPISREAVIPISTVGQQISVIANEAMKLLSEQMEERKKRRPAPQAGPVHRIIPPVLIRRETTA